MKSDTIVALSTPQGKSGVGVVRISGKESLSLAEKMFSPLDKKSIPTPNLMRLGKIDLGETQDLGFMVYFKSPKSYTGEDVIEFQCHGGIAVTKKIIEKVLSLGGRMAEPGEFSKRAFLNGKISLDEAEGVIDTINAETESELKAGGQLAKGVLAQKVNNMQEILLDLIADIEVSFDYPEEDIEYRTKKSIVGAVLGLKKDLDGLLSTSKIGKNIRNGVSVAIVGKTNVGKSSILNAILGEEQAIVTDIAGTTRDVVTGIKEFKGYKFNFFDTAGLRKTNDIVENIGINKAKETLQNSDIVLLVFDASRELDKEDKENLELTKNLDRVIVLNKSDLEKKCDIVSDITISAKSGDKVDDLMEMIFDRALKGNFEYDNIVLTNMRHVEILTRASKKAQQILDTIHNLPLDAVAVDVREMWDILGEITGVTTSEKIVDKIFSKFCLGK